MANNISVQTIREGKTCDLQYVRQQVHGGEPGVNRQNLKYFQLAGYTPVKGGGITPSVEKLRAVNRDTAVEIFQARDGSGRFLSKEEVCGK